MAIELVVAQSQQEDTPFPPPETLSTPRDETPGIGRTCRDWRRRVGASEPECSAWSRYDSVMIGPRPTVWPSGRRHRLRRRQSDCDSTSWTEAGGEHRKPLRIVSSSVQREFAEERPALRDYCLVGCRCELHQEHATWRVVLTSLLRPPQRERITPEPQVLRDVHRCHRRYAELSTDQGHRESPRIRGSVGAKYRAWRRRGTYRAIWWDSFLSQVAFHVYQASRLR